MASVIGSGIFNAVAFSAAGWLFSHLDHKGYSKEVRRHNLAMETLSREEAAWRERRDNEMDRLSKLRGDRLDALQAEKGTNKNLDLWKRVKEEHDEKEKKVKKRFEEERPHLKYTPSSEFASYIEYTKGMLLSGSLLGAAYLLL